MDRIKLVLGLLALLFFSPDMAIAQEKKNMEALRIETPLSIDGFFNEPVYRQAKPAKDFSQLQPYNGKPALQPSEAWFFYDQSAIYVGAMLYDSAPDSIYNFLTERDNIGLSDYFGVYFDPFNQGQLAFGFFINPSGVQVDIKATKNNGGGDSEDSNWNAVWQSKTRLTDKGWAVEMRIPFSELRFSNSGNTWGLNMFRNTRRYNSNTSWNFIDRKKDGFIDQQGHLSGIKDISPPVRFSLSPYLATYLESKDEGKTRDFLYKAGMDLKYGINESFTLDMMLIPDFGQIQSDDKELNLSPFELYYSEKRQFFTESTELFARGNIFYSRRIGAGPKFSGELSAQAHEKIEYNPTETQLINATKVSGRTNSGWGLGFLNAMTLPSFARIRNTETGDTRRVQVQPFTNYNVTVVDKSLKNNSYVSLINSNVSMVDRPFRANVTATEFQLRDRSKSYALSGKGGFSARGEGKLETGYFGDMALKKNKGDLQFGVGQTLYSDTYNPNDLGYLQNNNMARTNSWVYYQVVEPFSIFREVNGDIWSDYNRVFRPNVLSCIVAGYDLNATFTNNFSMYLNGGYQTDKYDYFEPRVKGRYYLSPRLLWHNYRLNTDWRKPLSFSFFYEHVECFDTDQFGNKGELGASYRLGQNLVFDYNLFCNSEKNNVGFVDKDDSGVNIHFAKRDILTLNNVLSASYVINNKASLNVRGRHYWSSVSNKAFYLLQGDGSLAAETSYTENKDQNYNAFTIDMNFRWVFAPGSELVLALKNAAYTSHDQVERNYWKNLHDSWKNQGNSLSLKVLYYIDYEHLGSLF